MDFALHASNVTLGELFSGRFAFVLPEFQREYAWDVAEAEHLLEDVEAARLDQERSDDLAPYFLGTMLFAEPTDDDPVREAQVVDGQQRMITLTILIAVLRDLATDVEEAGWLHRHVAVWSTRTDELGDQFHLMLRRADRAYMARTVQKLGATLGRRRRNALVPERAAHERIARVRGFFLKRLARDREASERAALSRFLLQHCCVLAMRTPSLDYAYQIFLTLNSRGLPLSDDDIVAAEVIGPLDRAQKDRFQPIIAQLARYREANEKKRSRDKTFFSHLTAMNGWGARSMITELRRAVAASGGAMAFTREVFQPMAEAYLLTRLDFSGRTPPEPVVEQLRALALLEALCDDEWVASAMLGLANLELDDPKLARFLAQLDRFAHAQLLLRPIRSDRRRKYRRANELLRANVDRIGDTDAFVLTEREQQKALDRCASGLANTASRTAKAILMRLDAVLSGRSCNWYLGHVNTSDPAAEPMSIEHVVPKGAALSKTSQWRTAFADDHDRRRIADYLGNLLLISQSVNRRVAQRGWSDKRRAFLGDPVTAQFGLVQAAGAYETWDRAALEARHAALMATVREIWSLSGSISPLPQLAAPVAPKRVRRSGTSGVVRQRAWSNP